MNHIYKNNWQETKERFQSWWKRENTDCPLLLIEAAKSIKNIKQSDERWMYFNDNTDMNMEKKWLDTDFLLNSAETNFSRNAYLGEALPHVWANLGAGNLATYIGAEPVFGKDTVWYKHGLSSIEDANLKFDKNSRWWQWTLEFTKKALKRSDGRYNVAIPDLIENLDILAALRGSQELLYDLVDYPEEIHRLQKQLLPIWFEAYDTLYNLTKDSQGWSSYCAFQIWGPGKTSKIQCDFSAMLSRDMYDEFVLPYLKEQSNRIDNVLYHLDGPDAIRHLDSVLSIESLDCIQWTPGAGNPDGGDPCWDELYKKILNAGKCIQAFMEPHLVKDFVKRIGKAGVLIGVYTDSVEEGEELIKVCRSI